MAFNSVKVDNGTTDIHSIQNMEEIKFFLEKQSSDIHFQIYGENLYLFDNNLNRKRTYNDHRYLFN